MSAIQIAGLVCLVINGGCMALWAYKGTPQDSPPFSDGAFYTLTILGVVFSIIMLRA